uniref:thiamine pyrophosphate-dependent enzyme n=1 Tax=Nocardia farcinica TaxID=37329 RepID=UPI0024544281
GIGGAILAGALVEVSAPLLTKRALDAGGVGGPGGMGPGGGGGGVGGLFSPSLGSPPSPPASGRPPPLLNLTEWWTYLDGVRKQYPLGWTPPSDGSLSPEFVIEALGRLAGPEAIYCAGVGQHQMWAAQFIKYEKPRTWLNSGGLGTMGYAVPAAMGAKMGMPDREVWAVDGDGCFQMTNQELATCAVEGVPIKVALINNGNLGMVRQWQTLFYEERYSNTDLGTHTLRIPDFVKLAEALGCHGIRVEKEEDVEAAIREAQSINDRPVVIDFIVGKDAQVWPMVAAGTSNDEIMAARGIRPLFDEDEQAAEPAVIHEAMTHGDRAAEQNKGTEE